ncbi:unnamed protein product [Mycena citricolor]|uniref:Uncharacterized protein n=1 Tax=Mycena citricolor TaxID=2018698 RepID=A0AAD2Q429_9AGAR|nr:unnamed protein product [Mycena citricolor]
MPRLDMHWSQSLHAQMVQDRPIRPDQRDDLQRDVGIRQDDRAELVLDDDDPRLGPGRELPHPLRDDRTPLPPRSNVPRVRTDRDHRRQQAHPADRGAARLVPWRIQQLRPRTVDRHLLEPGQDADDIPHPRPAALPVRRRRHQRESRHCCFGAVRRMLIARRPPPRRAPPRPLDPPARARSRNTASAAGRAPSPQSASRPTSAPSSTSITRSVSDPEDGPVVRRSACACRSIVSPCYL